MAYFVPICRQKNYQYSFSYDFPETQHSAAVREISLA